MEVGENLSMMQYQIRQQTQDKLDHTREKIDIRIINTIFKTESSFPKNYILPIINNFYNTKVNHQGHWKYEKKKLGPEMIKA